MEVHKTKVQGSSVYLGLWDNTPEDDPSRAEGLQAVIDTVERYGRASVSFDYNGRTRHESAAHVMAERLPEGYTVEIGYNYHFEVYKRADRVHISETFSQDGGYVFVKASVVKEGERVADFDWVVKGSGDHALTIRAAQEWVKKYLPEEK